MKVMHVASEVTPYSKTGGLADVLGALPRAQARLGLDVTIVAPRYWVVNTQKQGLARWLRTIPVPLGKDLIDVGVFEGTLPGGSKARVLLVEHEPSFGRAGLYGDASGDYADNARRFTLLGRAALTIASHLDFWPDVLHGHDWQAGPAIMYAQYTGGDLRPPATVLTVHNLAFQGIFPESVVDELGYPRSMWHPGGIEFYGNVSLLKAGLVLADKVTTVSPTYAKEIQTIDQGMAMDGILRARAKDLSGILNGVDYDVWSPERDSALAARYNPEDLSGKRACKAALQRELGLPVRPETPLFGSVSRLAYQKGFDLVLEALPQLLEEDLQYVLLGTGDPHVENALRDLAARHPTKLAVRFAYDDKVAHRIEAGCDMFVMPSRWEPCGLNQMYSLKYGTPPIVRATGGLEDTIVDYEQRSRSGTGFKFTPYTRDALTEAWRRALSAYRQPDEFRALQKRGMAQDFSWTASARRYVELYERLLAAKR
jgi:starch synthase